LRLEAVLSVVVVDARYSWLSSTSLSQPFTGNARWRRKSY